MSEMIREVAVSYRGARRRIPAVITPTAAADFVRRLVGRDAREHFVLVFLDSRHVPIGYQTASVGTATASLVHPREVFQPALLAGACALVLAHTHPSGNSSPSTEDEALTKRLVEAGTLLGVRVIDHVVVGDAIGGHVSLRETSPALWEE